MATSSRKLICIGGGLLRKGETRRIDAFVVAQSKRDDPRVLFIPTASKDLPVYVRAFRREYERLGCSVKTLYLFGPKKTSPTIRKRIVAESDIIYIGGGDERLLLSQWKKNGIIPLVKNAYAQGTILAGLSAGCVIWYENYFTPTQPSKRWVRRRGLGILTGGVVPHYQKDIPIPLDMTRKIDGNTIGIENACAIYYLNERLQKIIGAKGASAFTILPSGGRRKLAKTPARSS